MPPAVKKAPLDYLFAIVVALIVIGTSLVVDPPTTKYIVFLTGVVMLIAVLATAAKPDKAPPTRDGRQAGSTPR
ncbi:MAG: hypothetical protein M3137_11110 [Actinomycetota bacterium]|nr:hypothetical protein [Actinomycetota bacterium]